MSLNWDKSECDREAVSRHKNYTDVMVWASVAVGIRYIRDTDRAREFYVRHEMLREFSGGMVAGNLEIPLEVVEAFVGFRTNADNMTEKQFAARVGALLRSRITDRMRREEREEASVKVQEEEPVIERPQEADLGAERCGA